MILHNDPIKANEKNDYAKNDTTFFWGDNTVNLFSLALSPLNWLADYLSLSPEQVFLILKL